MTSDDLPAVTESNNNPVAVAPSPHVRQLVLTGTRPRPRRAHRWAVAPAVTFVALATLAGVGLVLHRGGGMSRELIRGPQLDVATVLAELEHAAQRTAPVTVPAGSYLYRRTDTTVAGLPPNAAPTAGQMTETWSQPPGIITVKVRSAGKDFESRPSTADIAEAQRREFARTGPSIRYPTAGWLAGLPIDPDRLLAELQRTAIPVHEPWAVCLSLFSRVDPLLPTAVRVALLKIMGATGGLSANEVTIGSQRYLAVRYSVGGVGDEVLFDRATAHAVGTATVNLHNDQDGAQSAASGPPASAAPDPDSLQLWTFKVVSSLPR